MTHVVLVAFEVDAYDMELAQMVLMGYLPRVDVEYSPIECWWIAEDERYDGSDCDSAVFVPMGMQQATTNLINLLKKA